ncbi:MAG: protein kinase [Cyanobacteria bacterium J06641_5]
MLRDCLPGGTLLENRYRIDYPLGQGGFGITYRAFDVTQERLVALKEFFPQEYVQRDSRTGSIFIPSTQQQEYRKTLNRFLKEGLILARLNHSGIVKVYDLLQVGDTAYLVMELVQGQSLQTLLESQPGKCLPAERVEAIAAALIDALAALHQQGIYHLDVAPDNILLTPEGRVVLIDLGAARQGMVKTRTHQPFKEAYAPYEVLAGEEVGPESDIYELGVTIYEMLTGNRPQPVLGRMVVDRWTPDGLAEPWTSLVRAALQVRRADRPQDVGQWWEAAWGQQKSSPIPEVRPQTPPAIPLAPTETETPSRSQVRPPATVLPTQIPPIPTPNPRNQVRQSAAPTTVQRSTATRRPKPDRSVAIAAIFVAAMAAMVGGGFLIAELLAPLAERQQQTAEKLATAPTENTPSQTPNPESNGDAPPSQDPDPKLAASAEPAPPKQSEPVAPSPQKEITPELTPEPPAPPQAEAPPAKPSSQRLTSGNILVSGRGKVTEYTRDGKMVQAFTVPPPARSTERIRDIAVDSNGRIRAYNGTFQPVLSTVNPTTNAITNNRFTGFGTVNNTTYGGIATHGNKVFLTDMQLSGDRTQGVIMYDGASSRRFATDVEPIDLNMGLDGLLYVLAGGGSPSGRTLAAYDPRALAKVRDIDLSATQVSSRRAVTANAKGEIFLATLSGQVFHLNSSGKLLKAVRFKQRFSDIDLARDGTMLLGTTDGVVLTVDAALTKSAPLFYGGQRSTVFATFVP